MLRVVLARLHASVVGGFRGHSAVVLHLRKAWMGSRKVHLGGRCIGLRSLVDTEKGRARSRELRNELRLRGHGRGRVKMLHGASHGCMLPVHALRHESRMWTLLMLKLLGLRLRMDIVVPIRVVSRAGGLELLECLLVRRCIVDRHCWDASRCRRGR